MKLFVIGNGFDLAHGMKTSYENFHQYLKDEYPDSDFEKFLIPESTMTSDGGESYDDVDVVSYLLRLISNAERNGDKWSDLENSLGFLDFDECFDDIEDLYDKDGDLDHWKNLYNTEDLASNLIIPTQSITEYFSDWIDTIEIDGTIPSKRDFASIINCDSDLFLTFNYTSTLETIYQVENVCHIHGEKGSKLLFGHGNDTDYYEENMGKYTGSESSLQQIQGLLKKDTVSAIEKHKNFFDDLSSSIDNIYSFGFSFSNVDEVYIKEICKRLKTEKVTWNLNDFESPYQREEYKKTIRSCGFRGHFSTYHIS